MELRVLKYFVVVAEEGKVTTAARLLNVTQPTLSRQIQDLEDELGVKLFFRGKKNITLTEDGILLYQKAREVIELSDKILDDYRVRREMGGIVSVGTVESVAAPHFMALLKRFSDRYPKVEFRIYNGFADDIKDKLDKGLVDIGMLVEPVEISKYDSTRLPYKDQRGVIVPEGHALAGRTSVRIEDLIEFPLIIPKGSSAGKEVRRWLKPFADHIHVVAAYNLLSNTSYLVENGMGIAIGLNGPFLAQRREGLVFVPFEPESRVRSVIVWKKNPVFSPAARMLLTMILEEYGEEDDTF